MEIPRQWTYAIDMTVRFRRITRRDGVLIRGDAGWGEISPFWDYDAHESAAWYRAGREAADQGFPPALRDRIPVNVTIPACSPDKAHELVEASGGCTTAKVKVAEPGQSVDEEIARLEAVRDALGPAGKIRIDANAAWDREEALSRLRLLDKAAGTLEYAEQPTAALEDLAWLRRAQEVPIAADESIRRAEDPLRVKAAEAADVVVLKVQPIGGVRACLRLAEQIALPVVVSSALETSVGLAMGVALAAALPELPYACGLGTGRLLARDICADRLLPTDGALPVRPIAPDIPGYRDNRADAATASAWDGRLAEIQTELAKEANND